MTPSVKRWLARYGALLLVCVALVVIALVAPTVAP